MSTQLAVGDPAPSFESTSTRGERVRLEDFRGRYLVLYFFPKAFTPGCTHESKRFRDNYPELQAHGAEVVGVSTDGHATQCEFAQRYELTFPLVEDPGGRISEAYGVKRRLLPLNKRITFVIDPEGKIAARFHHDFQVNRHLDEVVRFFDKLPKSQEA